MATKGKLRVLIADKMSAAAKSLLENAGLAVDVIAGLPRDELVNIIGKYDGLVVRSSTKVTPPVIAAAERLKVIGRAGIGVDNIDVAAATAKGIAVINTPWGNSVTTAEHTIALIVALVRHIPAANASTHLGKWEKSRFEGIELSGKILGIIGCGNIGSIVAMRAQGLKMKVCAYDPFLPDTRAQELGVEKVNLPDLLAQSDIISLHTPLTDKTRHILNARSLAQTKPGVRIINCARGGLIDEQALKAALDKGHVAGAAFDVYETEPATQSVFFGMEQVICTPHLGASTYEAQENVARQVAEYMADYLQRGIIHAAVNLPSTVGEQAQRLRPYAILGEQLGELLGQMVEHAVQDLSIEYVGEVQELDCRPLTLAIIAGFLRPHLADVNAVNALAFAKDRGLRITETRQDAKGAYDSYVRLMATTQNTTRSVAGTLFSDGLPRIIQIMGLDVKADLAQHMIYVRNKDRPGFIGALGTILGQHKVNIASFNLGRDKPEGIAIALLGVDNAVTDKVLKDVQTLDGVLETRRLKFNLR